MNVEIVLDQNDGLGIGEVDIGQILQDVGIVDSSVAVGRFGLSSMDAQGTARLFLELSNFYCHPGRAGGSPLVTRVQTQLHHIQ